MSAKIVAIEMPKWGMSMEEGTLAQWLVKEGDTISVGDSVVEVETAKIVNTVESSATGRLVRYLVNEGETHPVGAALAVVAQEDVKAEEVDAFIASIAGVSTQAVTMESVATIAAIPVVDKSVLQVATGVLAQGPDDSNVHASPVARKLARKLNVNLNNVTGSGRNNRISKSDVEAALRAQTSVLASSGSTDAGNDVRATPVAKRLAEKLGIDLTTVTATGSRGRISKHDIELAAKHKKAASAVDAGVDTSLVSRSQDLSIGDVKHSAMRKVIAARLTESKQTIPHFRVTVDCNIDALLAARKVLNQQSEVKISVNDFVLKASACALKQVPAANVSFQAEYMRYFEQVDISMAVAVDAGLLTPVLRGVENKGLATIAAESKDLASRAQQGKLNLDELEGGSFSVSNLGMFGVKQFDAIINPPQAAILAVSAGEPRPVVIDGKLAIATMMTVSLSCDHRAIDGAVGAQLLQAFKGFIEKPASMLL